MHDRGYGVDIISTLPLRFVLEHISISTHAHTCESGSDAHTRMHKLLNRASGRFTPMFRGVKPFFAESNATRILMQHTYEHADIYLLIPCRYIQGVYRTYATNAYVHISCKLIRIPGWYSTAITYGPMQHDRRCSAIRSLFPKLHTRHVPHDDVIIIKG